MDIKEAIEVIKKNCPHVGISGSQFEIALRELVPELAESEDERIRKELLNFVKDFWVDHKEKLPQVSKWIAYLEKLKDFQFEYPGLYFYDGEKLHFEGNPAIEEKKKGQELVEMQDYSGLTDFERAIYRGFLCAGVENVPVTIIKETAQDCLSHIEQKPAEWSEEDGKMLQRVINAITGYTPNRSTEEDYEMISWLNSLLSRPKSDDMHLTQEYSLPSNLDEATKKYGFEEYRRREDCADLFIVTPEPELTEFEQEYKRLYLEGYNDGNAGSKPLSDEVLIDTTAELLELAKEELRNQGFTVEKHNAQFDECAAKVPQEVIKEVFDNIDKVVNVISTEFEYAMLRYLQDGANAKSDEEIVELTKKHSAELLAIAAKERGKNITANLLEDKIGGIQHDLIEFLSNTIDANWVDIIKSANSYAQRIRNIVLNDLPRWKKAKEYTKLGSNDYVFTLDNNGKCSPYWDTEVEKGQYYITESDLEKLPKED